MIESLLELLERFCKNPSPIDRNRVQAIRRDAYIGITKGSVTGKDTMFLLRNNDRSSNEFSWLMKQNQNALDNLREIYKVVEVTWDSSFTEVQARGSAA